MYASDVGLATCVGDTVGTVVCSKRWFRLISTLGITARGVLSLGDVDDDGSQVSVRGAVITLGIGAIYGILVLLAE